MENHHYSWENPLFQWSFSIAMLVHQRVSWFFICTDPHILDWTVQDLSRKTSWAELDLLLNEEIIRLRGVLVDKILYMYMSIICIWYIYIYPCMILLRLLLFSFFMLAFYFTFFFHLILHSQIWVWTSSLRFLRVHASKCSSRVSFLYPLVV